MANYSLVLDTRFNPFSYDELIKPALMQTQAHQAIEEEYSNLAQKANIWDKLADEQTDSLAYTMYKNYSNDLSAKADQLLREGLNASSRKGMLDMRARYSKEITPIENAYNRRKELADEQRKAMAADPTLRYQNYANSMSLDDFIRNPSLDYGASYSGALLTKQVSQAVEGYKKYLTHKGDLSRLGLPAQYERELRSGVAPDVVMSLIYNRAIQGTDPDAIAFLNGVVRNVLDSSGVRRWADADTMRDYEGFARQGLYNAIGSVDLKNYTDTAGIQAMRGAGNSGGGGDDRNNNGLYFRPLPNTSINGDIDTSQLALDIRFIQNAMNHRNIMEIPDLPSMEEIIESGAQTSLQVPDIFTNTPRVFDPRTEEVMARRRFAMENQQRLANLAREYNIPLGENTTDTEITNYILNNPNIANQLTDAINREISRSALRSQVYALNIADSSLMIRTLGEDIAAHHSVSGSTGLRELNNNRVGDELSSGDAVKYLTGDDAHVYFDVDKGLVLTTTVDGEMKSAVIDTELYDTVERTYRRAQEQISTALENGDTETFNTTVAALMQALYNKYNTLPRRQGTTLSRDRE